MGSNGGSNDNSAQEDFPSVDDADICRPPRRNDPRKKTLPGGAPVKWCSECGL